MVQSIRRRHSACVAAMLVLAVVPAGATIIIDPFTTTQATSVGARALGQITTQTTINNSTAANAPFALGGQRELYYHRMFGTSAGGLNTNSDNFEAATFKTGSNGVANGLLVYDGTGIGIGLGATGAVNVSNATGATDAARLANAESKVQQFRFGAPDTMGLGALDLTEGGLNDRIRLSAYADNQGTQVVFRFFLTANKYAELLLNIPGSDVFAYNSYDILFTDFTAVGFAANESILSAFSGTNAITMQINGGASTDASFDFFAATSAVPEPFSTSLMSGGLLFLGVMKLRKKRLS